MTAGGLAVVTRWLPRKPPLQPLWMLRALERWAETSIGFGKFKNVWPV